MSEDNTELNNRLLDSLNEFKKNYPSATSGDLQGFIIGWKQGWKEAINQSGKEKTPQWLIDHIATAPKELQDYVFDVFPERYNCNGQPNLSENFLWEATLEGHRFWISVDNKNWKLALVILRKNNLI